MNKFYVSILIALLFVFAISINAQESEEDCPKFCTFDYKPVCGYDGSMGCHRIYGNACALKVDRCSGEKKKDVKSVEMARCDEAQAKSNPGVVACSDPEP